MDPVDEQRSPQSARAITSNQLPDALVPIDLGTLLPPAYGFGLGVAVLVHEDVTPEPGHGGGVTPSCTPDDDSLATAYP